MFAEFVAEYYDQIELAKRDTLTGKKSVETSPLPGASFADHQTVFDSGTGSVTADFHP